VELGPRDFASLGPLVMDGREILEVVVLVLGVASLFGAAFAVLRSKTITTSNEHLQKSVESISGANDELREQIDFVRVERLRERDDFTQKLHEQELRCSSEIAELRGQVKTYESGLAERLVKAVVEAIQSKEAA
jgi:hypothetical protein